MVWPENVPAVNLLIALRTQWRVSPAGIRYGLDYSAITPLILKSCDITEEQWADHVFHDLRVAEEAALDTMAKHRKASQ